MPTKRNLIITGASGFIGRSVIAELLNKTEEFNIFALVRKSTFSSRHVNEIIIEDISDLSWLNSFDQPIDTIIHLAALAHNKFDKNTDNPVDIFKRLNVNATKNIASKAAEKMTRRFIFISSIGVLGNATYSYPFSDISPAAPVADYAISKHEAENELKKVCENTKMEFVIVRPPLVYGFDAPGNFSRLLSLVEKGVPLPLGSIKNSRSFISCENLANFICHCVRHSSAANQIFLVADNTNISTPHLVKMLADAMNAKTIVFPFPIFAIRFACFMLKKKNLYQQLCGSLEVDSSKAKNLLAWSPPYSSEERIAKAAVAFWESQRGT